MIRKQTKCASERTERAHTSTTTTTTTFCFSICSVVVVYSNTPIDPSIQHGMDGWMDALTWLVLLIWVGSKLCWVPHSWLSPTLDIKFATGQKKLVGVCKQASKQACTKRLARCPLDFFVQAKQGKRKKPRKTGKSFK